MLIGAACAAALAASAMGNLSSQASPSAYVPSGLLAAARTNPNHVYRVISWGTASRGTASWGSSELAQPLASSNASWGAAAMADVAPDTP